MSENFDVIVIGAGIVGLATALQLKRKYNSLKILIVEKEMSIARHQTGNNSGVIHSGIYYTPGSLKARNCRRGYDLLLEFAAEHQIDYELCGKVIVATEENELNELDKIYHKGIANGLENLKLLDAQEIKEIEPFVAGIRAIHVPQAGIIDYKAVCQQYRSLLKGEKVVFKFGERVIGIKEHHHGVDVQTRKISYSSKKVIACGGLYSDKLALMTLKDVEYKIVPFRGEYYDLKPEAQYLVKGLIYPVPDPNFPFLGVHFTKTIQGGIESGPNAVFAFSREGYRKRDIHVGELIESLTYSGMMKIALRHWKAGSMEMYRSFSKRAYLRTLKKLIPSIQSDHIVKGNSGVRAQAVKKNGSMVDDFLILDSERVINVCNAPSPAATSSLAIGETIANLI